LAPWDAPFLSLMIKVGFKLWPGFSGGTVGVQGCVESTRGD